MFLNRDSNTNSSIFLADPLLFAMGITYFVITTVVCTVMIFVCFVFYMNTDIVIFFFCLFAFSIVIGLCALPKWRIIIEITEDGISYKPTFKKEINKKYSDFGYFYCASYSYYTERKYIVFSQRRLNDYELTHINNVAVSDKLIKIKVRKGLKEELSPFLPPKFLFRIPKDFW